MSIMEFVYERIKINYNRIKFVFILVLKPSITDIMECFKIAINIIIIVSNYSSKLTIM